MTIVCTAFPEVYVVVIGIFSLESYVALELLRLIVGVGVGLSGVGSIVSCSE